MRRSTNNAERGILSTAQDVRGLVVELAGFQVSLIDHAKDVPNDLAGFDSLPQGNINRRALLMRDKEGRWYLVDHRDTQAHRGILVTELATLRSQGDELVCVETASHVKFGHLSTELNLLCQAAYDLAQELAASDAARRLQDFTSSQNDMDHLSYQDAFKAFNLELQRLSSSSTGRELLIANGNNVDERGFARVREYAERIWRGLYLQMDRFVPNSQKWCVD
ncbi:uncharacterized protein KY384_000042 [Bacidia gigantensis]|uniref:uncharacterized protein n=1 Tax=Bacidia gigantensis TaxID=2732470 RepID=UPI001D050BB1|nr:uncharacterized protein KY384_000042 [Bacidia gigantensis]KAG8526449.1 hypothetical protein KY384_000042 [Bacidia gigantensis]